MVNNPIFDNRDIDEKEVSSDASSLFISMITKIVNDCIQKRLKQDDIMRCYTGQVNLSNAEQNTTTGEWENISPVGVECDEEQYNNVINITGEPLHNGDFVRIFTCDDVRYYCLHKI